VNLQNGTTLGPYEIVAPIGAGGMGEVYRARDTRLDRSVALKILPNGVYASPLLRARFEREARAISSISHPHICALYDVGHAGGTDYLVMEYLEGESLASRLSRGPLPISQVLRYGAEIAQALHHAHRRGITHRDLKPGNVMLTASGAKLLDFGLAKLVQQPRSVSGQSETVTRAEPLTSEGAIVGTVPYMSPEQVEGKELDARSDIFSLGTLLYEMATGRRPFPGNSSPALIAAILSNDPPPDPAIPPALDRVIRTALEKNPDDRWQTAHDLARQLRWLGEPSSGSHTAATPHPRRRVPLVAALLVAAIGAGVIGWVIARRNARSLGNLAALHLTMTFSPDVRLISSADATTFAISPDGKRVAFLRWVEDSTELYVRAVDSTAAVKIAGADGASIPFWSSDGGWLGYSALGKLWKTRVSGGTPEAICNVSSAGAMASWRGDTILFADRPDGRTALYRVSSSGGEPVAVAEPRIAEHETRYAWPHLLADGKHYLFIAAIENSVERRLLLGSLDSPVRRRLATNVSNARVSGDRLLFVRDGKLLAQRFDVTNGLTGDPSIVAEDVNFFLSSARAEFDVSDNGVVVYRNYVRFGRLVILDRTGAERRVIADNGAFNRVDVSPDGKKAAFAVGDRANGLMDIWIYDLARGVQDRFTSELGVETAPVWSPDGRTVVYSASTGTPPRLVRRAISAPAAQPIVAPGNMQMASSISRDGKTLYYECQNGKTRSDIFRTTLDGTNRSEAVLKSEFNETSPALSPDERWLAYASDATGKSEVFLMNLADGERIRVSTGGGYHPRWAGDELFFYQPPLPDRAMMRAVPRVAGRWNDVVVSKLFSQRNSVLGLDTLPDGSGFIVAEWTPGPAESHIHVVTGW
jgi:eukaryotic-like serine/threonine-protein kinase